MPRVTSKMQSWQVFRAARKTIGLQALTAIFGKKNARTIYLYSQDPACTEDRCNDPLQSLHKMFTMLDEFGRGDVVRIAIGYLMTATEDDDHLPDETKELLPTIQQELLADYAAVASLQRAIDAGEEIDLVDTLREKAVQEIDRTFAKYLGERGARRKGE